MRGDDHVSAPAVDHRVECMLKILDIADSLLLADFPTSISAWIKAAYIQDALVRVVPIGFVDAVNFKVHVFTPFRRALYGEVVFVRPRRFYIIRNRSAVTLSCRVSKAVRTVVIASRFGI